MDDTTMDDEPLDTSDAPSEPDAAPEEITEEEVRRSLEKLLPRYEQMLRNLAE